MIVPDVGVDGTFTILVVVGVVVIDVSGVDMTNNSRSQEGRVALQQTYDVMRR